MRGACRNVALTCAYAVFYDSNVKLCYDANQDGTVDQTSECSVVNTGTTSDDQYIEGISSMFYQSLLCPDNSTYSAIPATSDLIGNGKKWVNAHCMCNDNSSDNGYEAWGTSCLLKCPSGSTRNSYGTCQQNTNE